MQKMHFSIVIDAPKKKVWEIMLGKDTYGAWTDEFMPGSHYVGEWREGSRMLFLAPDEAGKMSGMVSLVREVRPYDRVSIENIGIVQDGREDTSSEAVKSWAGTHEDYTFKEVEGKTEVLVEMDTDEQNKEMFQGIWPKALKKLKDLVEH
ncbi:MAG: hypothetical protein BWZ01_02131 [Deltaproteobacteria bacterium ADurb.BinA179]|jgi:uncharacterized protein YndB with AHSA1/START domain|nr:SRPBCC domain-containing protein [Deltaproteobacteria bacterium]MDI9543243.1 SRPBCC domain-containing protein [Pseudomonadota bacterium]NLW67545.1 SRPBCC domain-containing protein [Bacteriovoracaceae bacterium]OPZ26373.1 MAG: hypothetical protein BWZ01_02131 [Deltaproteobacteria bacterium ADurb.BinA179]HRR22279.1 SRPBCC domain-containing protein [Desulfomonilia bacterium]